MFYTTKELSTLLRYESPRTFLVALRKKNTDLMRELWSARIPAKVGRRILWNIDIINQILKGQ